MTRRDGGERFWRAVGVAYAAVLALALAGCPAMTPVGTVAPPVRVQPTPPVRPAYSVYEVRKGDTLYSLGRRFGVTATEIAADNGIISPNAMAVGTLLVIRRTEQGEAPPPVSATPLPAPARNRPISKTQLSRGKPNAQFWWPTDGALARRFGESFRGFSEPGIAIRAPAGTEVYAVADGTVVSCVRGGDGPESVWGNVVTIAHAGDTASWYGHLANILVKEGARVSKGEPIGTVGSTGVAPSPMLAFRLFRNKRPVNPLDYLP